MSNSVIAILRIVHIVFGAFWLGSVTTIGFFLLPAAKAAGPSGEQFATQLIARARLLTLVAVAGVIAVLAGLVLYGSIWAGAGFFGPARWYAMGGHFALLAVILAAAVVVPAARKLAALGRTLAAQETPPSDEQNALRERLTKRLTWLTRLSAVLLVITAAFMAIGRYV